jgi:hypothetical protein
VRLQQREQADDADQHAGQQRPDRLGRRVATTSALITRPRNSSGVDPSSTVVSPASPAAIGTPTIANSTR